LPLVEAFVLLDISNKQARFSKQEHEDGIATMGSRIEVDVPKNVGMSVAKQVDVMCDGNILEDIEKNVVVLCTISKRTYKCHISKFFFYNSE